MATAEFSKFAGILSAALSHPRVPLRDEGSCGVGGASRDSAGSGKRVHRGGLKKPWGLPGAWEAPGRVPVGRLTMTGGPQLVSPAKPVPPCRPTGSLQARLGGACAQGRFFGDKVKDRIN